ncbi:hypothetical protein BSKO_08348 [Bryopsis sp. KO-2023]|nr:hypothetical protein BSKO_08348 [Bryopsis sp. KO-2023]
MGKSEVVVIVMVVLAAWIGSTMASPDGATARSLLRRGKVSTSPAEKALQAASKKGDVKVVKRLLGADVDANAMSDQGMTPLMMASKYNHAAIVQALVTSGIDTEIRTSAGSTALWLAAEAGNADIIRALVKGGADVEAQNNEGKSPLFVATEKGHMTAVKALLSMGCNPDSVSKQPPITPLGQAAENGLANVARALLEAGASVHGGPKSKAPLGIAAEAEDFGVAKLLMKYGADLNRGDAWDGSTPLHCAAKKCKLVVVTWLIDHGAELDLKDGKGRTPGAVACMASDLGPLPEKELEEMKHELERVLDTSSGKGVSLLTSSDGIPVRDVKKTSPKSSKDVETPEALAARDPDTPSSVRPVPKVTTPLIASSASFLQRGGSISTVDPTATPPPSKSTMEDKTIIVIVCAAASLMVLVSIIYLFGVRRWGEGRDHDVHVEKLEKGIQAVGGKNESKFRKGSKRPTRSAAVEKLSEELGRAEMERMGSTPLNFATECTSSSSSGSPPIVPPLRLNQVEELKRKKREARALERKPKGKGAAHQGKRQDRQKRQDREDRKIRVIEPGENPLDSMQKAKVMRSTWQSASNPRRIAGSTDVVKRAFASETFSRSRVLDLKMGDFGVVNASFDKGDPEEPVVESLSIYCDPEGTPELTRKGNSLLKVQIEEFPMPDFDSTTDQSDKLFEQPSVSRRLSLTGSF